MWLDLKELGAVGEAYVTSVGPCPEIEAGPGRLVLTTFVHSPTQVVSLRVSGEAELIGVTPNHPFYSDDQRDWVGATGLAVGERLAAIGGGEALALGWQVRGDEPVYNIEVDGDHCYRVGEQGLLVHNASDPCSGLIPGYNHAKWDPPMQRSICVNRSEWEGKLA